MGWGGGRGGEIGGFGRSGQGRPVGWASGRGTKPHQVVSLFMKGDKSGNLNRWLNLKSGFGGRSNRFLGNCGPTKIHVWKII